MNNETITQLINQATTSGKLDLCEQQLTMLPPTVVELTNLEELYLDNNQLAELPAEIAQLVNLRVFSLTDNRLKALPSSIVELKNLEWLYLGKNQLAKLPTEITQLPNLKVISLNNNQIKALPEAITNLPSLKVLSLYNNPLTSPPPEIVAKGSKAIIIYLRQQARASQQQWAAKLLLVGEGGVGKTSLLRALQGEPFAIQEETTYGIEVDTWKLKHPTKDVFMQLKTWDFGGQTIYHATHQFFLTNRALFILVWNARLGYEQGKLSYWLNTIQARAPESPVLIVATHIDEHNAVLPFAELKRKYPQIIGGKYGKVSNKTGVGVNEVRQAIAEATAGLPRMGEIWPTHWLKTANTIRAKSEKYMTPTQLKDLMTTHGLAQDEIVTLSNWLHELGDLLYFQDNQDLKNIVILKPQWVTEHISRVLTSQQIIDNQGVLTNTYRDTLWPDLEHEMREHFSNLMEQFDLSYRALDDRHTSLIVECLPIDPPDYQTAWNAMQNATEIRMTYELNTIPPGIPTWFIARSHRFTTNTHWLYGALFADNPEHHHLGLVQTFPEERQLRLAVRGPYPHYFFDVLRDGLELTLQRFPGLKITRQIPCLGHNGQPCSYEFDYAELENAMQKGVTGVQCRKEFENVSVIALLFGLDRRTQDAVSKEIETLLKGSEEKLINLIKLTQHNISRPVSQEQKQQDLECPYTFALTEHKAKWWQPFAVREISLQLYCQYPGQPHPTEKGGCYPIPEFEKWVHVLAPHLSKLVGLYNAIVSLGSTLGTIGYKQQLKHDLEFMNELTQNFSPVDKIPEGAIRRSLYPLLTELDQAKRWGGLEPIPTPEGHVLWLCEKHASEYQQY